MKINLILLAAGNSRRFGSNKLLHVINGKPMYKHVTDTVDSLPEGIFTKKIIVTQYEELLADPWLNSHYQVVCNPDSARGISSSIQIGMNNAEDGVDAWCFLVCDQPDISRKTIEGFVVNWEKSGKPLGSVVHQTRLGSPTIFSKVYKTELLSLTGDVGGKGIIKGNQQVVYFHEVEDEKELQDIDVNAAPE